MMMKTLNAELAVIVTAYNAEATLNETISSILSSALNLDYVLIILDDGSTDKTFQIASSFSKVPNVYVEKSKINIGRAAALNHAISILNSEFIAIVDADDLVTTERFHEALSVLKSQPEIDCVAGQLKKFGDWGISQGTSNYPTDMKLIGAKLGKFRNVVGHSGVTFRRNWFNNLSGYRNFERCQDLDLFVRGFKDNYFISKKLYYYYRTSTKKTPFKYFMKEEYWREKVKQNALTQSKIEEKEKILLTYYTKGSIFFRYLLLRFIGRT
jgi:glycosyltransferase involved in cell wall biosynthesis